ncbi:MAG: hypothetical protein AMXMBFR81_16800 [Chthonomonas sp.]
MLGAETVNQRYLLDTSCLVRAATGQFLPPSVERVLADRSNELFLSPVSIWELELKVQLGKLVVGIPVREAVQRMIAVLGLQVVDLDMASAFRSATLPLLHRDPFDRMLICQAIEHGCTLVTSDTMMRSYPVRTLWAGV